MNRTTTVRLGAAAATLTLAALLVGCGASGGDAADSDKTTTTASADKTTTTAADTTTTAAEEETTTTDGSDTEEGVDTETSELDTLEDGDHYGYMAGHEMGMVEGQEVEVILWDEVEFLTGQAAVDAAHEDGAIPDDQDFIENDYYIRNNNSTIRRLAVVPDAQVYSLDGGSPEPVVSSTSEVWDDPYLFKINVGNVRDITTISSIEGVFVP